ncbi:hypothetical protein FQN57_005077 [Myotisia sp. PD_48]|nr:hypothetical protein FQN57_005077 [Myotisia sp. PD_48]
MREYWFLFLICGVKANIIFKPAALSCDPILPAFQGCLRGQRCSRHGTCENAHPTDLGPIRPLIMEVARPAIPRQMVGGGPADTPKVDKNNFDVCPEDAGTENSGCALRAERKNLEKEVPIPDKPGNGTEPKIISPILNSTSGGNTADTQTADPLNNLEFSITVDGMCGSSYRDTVCGDWLAGSCCSPYGFCGNTTAHCGSGCQSGPCLEAPALKPIAPLTYHPPQIAGEFKIVGQSGVPAMIAVLMPNGKVVFADKVENYTQLVLPNGQFAYSSEYDPSSNKVIPLPYKSNVFCAGGSFLVDGRVVLVGGNGPLKHIDPTVGDGFRGIRFLERRFDDEQFENSTWIEPGNLLSSPRWYPTMQILPDGRLVVVSGSANGLNPMVFENNNPTYEILDRNGFSTGDSILLSILEKNQPYYMYPFIHLLKDGTLFIFVSKSADLYDVDTDTVVKSLPDLRGDYRTYPNTGGSVLLPLSPENGWEPEIMVCGGGAYQDLNSPTDSSCGRIKPLSEKPAWEVEPMPNGRGMVEGMLLPDGTVIWINGCNRGAQGFGIAKDPIYEPWIYIPHAPRMDRWAIGGQTTIARMYHSVALLLLDGTVMVAGSNPVEQPVLVPNPNDPMAAYVTEFRVEIYTPHYLMDGNENRRPFDVSISSRYLSANGRRFTITFNIHENAESLRVALYHGGVVTHSLHMGHRMLYLDSYGWRPGRTRQNVRVTMPPNSRVAPPGPYVVYVVVDGVPSMGQFVMVENSG